MTACGRRRCRRQDALCSSSLHHYTTSSHNGLVGFCSRPLFMIFYLAPIKKELLFYCSSLFFRPRRPVWELIGRMFSSSSSSFSVTTAVALKIRAGWNITMKYLYTDVSLWMMNSVGSLHFKSAKDFAASHLNAQRWCSKSFITHTHKYMQDTYKCVCIYMYAYISR